MLLSVVMALLPVQASADARIKDIAKVQGVRENELFGYGLVVGLNGTGDRAQVTFTVQAVVSMLKKLGITVPGERLTLKNVAAVMVTAKLPPFAKAGSALDVTVSSMGDATNLQGGTLLITPLQAADGQVYAVAQGPVSIGGFNFEAGGTGEKVQKNHPTVGRVPNGAIVERELSTEFLKARQLQLVLANPDFTTAVRMAQAVGASLGADARAKDASTVEVRIPDAYLANPVELIAALESVSLAPDTSARVVVNERTGTIIMGSQVRISTVAVAHSNLSLQIRSELQVSQPAPLSEGQTTVVPRTEVEAREDKTRVNLMSEGVSIGDLIKALNALAVTPRDMISLLQAIKAAGALQGELEII
ncbi:MAG: flagellar biosynthesis protein FlgA [Candidatus Methylomirabilota bacterium]|nr:flagellar basal body P-ring protein FlgI [Candidatus Methylomirabilis sp.]NJD69423.1 flagellar basal body P-ring protein FlgI [candidate division NC10 bacterium]PWB43542.1 MAG: flagellar biosynthesis protein FlgA [candidate division NC10 bacterium]